MNSRDVPALIPSPFTPLAYQLRSGLLFGRRSLIRRRKGRAAGSAIVAAALLSVGEATDLPGEIIGRWQWEQSAGGISVVTTFALSKDEDGTFRMHRSFDEGESFELATTCSASKVGLSIVLRPTEPTESDYWVIDHAKNLLLMDADGAIGVAGAISTLKKLSFVTTEGKRVENVDLVQVMPTGLMIRNPNGLETIGCDLLPEDVLKRFGFTPESIAAGKRQAAEDARLYQDRLAAEQELRRATSGVVEVFQVLRPLGGALAREPGRSKVIFIHGALPANLVDATKLKITAVKEAEVFEYQNALGALATVSRWKVLSSEAAR